MKRGGRLKRRSPLRARRKTEEERDAWAEWGRATLARSSSKCERCLRGWQILPPDPHHLWTKGRGGPDKLWNSACLCRWCHTAIHDHTCDDWRDWLASSEERAREIRARLDERLKG